MSETILGGEDFKRKFEEELLRKQSLLVNSVDLLSRSFDLVTVLVKLQSERLDKFEAESKELREKVREMLRRIIAIESRGTLG